MLRLLFLYGLDKFFYKNVVGLFNTKQFVRLDLIDLIQQ